MLTALFGETADEYERGRPTYPVKAVRWLIETPQRVVDLGAGTGKLTERLVGIARQVVAVEPALAMVKKLNARLAAAHAVCGQAGAIPIRSGWADCVVVAQAFHWFDEEPALREIARVLTEDGRLAIVWNVRDESVPWVAELSRITGGDNSTQTRMTLKRRPHFEEFESRSFRTLQPVDRQTLIAQVRSRSHVAALDDAKRNSIIGAVLELCDRHPDLRGKRSFEFPYKTEAFRTHKT
jgi:SAM-dependent methyltransferase